VTVRITHRPLKRRGPRRNADGLWRCTVCTTRTGEEVYLPEAAFDRDYRRDAPVSACKACANARSSAWASRRALDAAWWDKHLAQQRNRDSTRRVIARRSQARARDRRDRSNVARALMFRLHAHGLSDKDIRLVARISRQTLVLLRNGGESYQCDVVDRLSLLVGICESVPVWVRRGRSSPGHPHLPAIARRYQALRAAHAA
jgi:hypothetical protein